MILKQQVNQHALCQTIRTLSGYNAESLPRDPVELLDDIVNEGLLRLPCDSDDVFLVPDRVPIFSDIQRSPQNSILLRQLFDRYADTGLVVDALLSGKNSVFLVRLTDDDDEVIRWVRGMNSGHVALTLRSIDATNKLIVVSLASFVVPKTDG
jgi:hypothetical protein